MRGSRARITVVDVLIYLTAVAALSGLYPVYVDAVESNSWAMAEGTVLVVKTGPPVMVLVLLGTIIAKAGLGAK